MTTIGLATVTSNQMHPVRQFIATGLGTWEICLKHLPTHVDRRNKSFGDAPAAHVRDKRRVRIEVGYSLTEKFSKAEANGRPASHRDCPREAGPLTSITEAISVRRKTQVTDEL
jgi:hypothetical protein